MKYYLIVGEASGDLHASHLMQSLKDILITIMCASSFQNYVDK